MAENHRSRILWTEQFMYAIYDRGTPRELLTDLQNDPGQLHNLAVENTPQEVLAQHRDMLRQWYRDHEETLNPKYLVSPEH